MLVSSLRKKFSPFLMALQIVALLECINTAGSRYTAKHNKNDYKEYIQQVAALSLSNIFHRDKTSPPSGLLKRIYSLGGIGRNNDRIVNRDDNIVPFEKWVVIVHEYSGRSLSYPQDRLDAISGVAQQFSEMMSSEYVAGIWKTDVFKLQGLLWKQTSVAPVVRDNDDGRIREPRYCPSWSWASEGGKVEYYDMLSLVEPVRMAKVENVYFRLSSKEHPYGDVSEAVVVLTGECGYLPLGCSGWITLDTMVKEKEGIEYLAPTGKSKSWRDQRLSSTPVELLNADLWIFCGPPFYIRIVDIDRNADVETWVILLEPSGNEGTFRRIGIGKFRENVDPLVQPSDPWSDWGSQEQTIKTI